MRPGIISVVRKGRESIADVEVVSLFGAVPALHKLQVDDPAFLATLPLSHHLQDALVVAASTLLYLPGAHGLQAVDNSAPTAALYFPREQF